MYTTCLFQLRVKRVLEGGERLFSPCSVGRVTVIKKKEKNADCFLNCFVSRRRPFALDVGAFFLCFSPTLVAGDKCLGCIFRSFIPLKENGVQGTVLEKKTHCEFNASFTVRAHGVQHCIESFE